MSRPPYKTICRDTAHLTLFWGETWVPLDTAYGAFIAPLRCEGHVGQFALLQSKGNLGHMLSLFAEAYWAARQVGMDIGLIAVAPAQAQHYGRLGWRVAGGW